MRVKVTPTRSPPISLQVPERILMNSLVPLYLTQPSVSYENWVGKHCTILNHTAAILLYRSAWNLRATVYQTPICHTALKRKTNSELHPVPGSTLSEDNSVVTLKSIHMPGFLPNRNALAILELDLWNWGDGKTHAYVESKVQFCAWPYFLWMVASVLFYSEVDLRGFSLQHLQRERPSVCLCTHTQTYSQTQSQSQADLWIFENCFVALMRPVCQQQERII